MHFYDLISNLAQDKDLMIFCDMDGVIASYDVGKPYDFLEKRPLTENIRKLEAVSKIPNVDICILSICRKDFQQDEKNKWLDINAPFFKKENRNIISKESNPNYTSPELKANFLNTVKTDKQIILIDDDNQVIKHVGNNVEGIILFQDSELID